MIKPVLMLVSVATMGVAAVSGPAGAQPEAAPAPSVEVPLDVLERYVGRYELNGAVVDVTVTEAGRLIAQLSGQPPAPPLRTISANEFFADAVGVRLWFEGEGPKASRIRSRFNGSEAVGTRLPDDAPSAAPPAPPIAALDAASRRGAVAALGTALRQGYVFPDVAEQAAARLDAALAAGAYDSLTDPRAFAERLRADVDAIAHDKHLRIDAMGGPPPAPPPGAAEMPAVEGGVVRADRLAGNIGYIEVTGFPPPPAFKPAVDRAMAALEGSEALVIDVRRNGGGDPATVAYLTSFLVPPGEPMHLNDIVSRVAGTTEFRRQAFNSQPTPVSFAGRPVYVLTSKRTFSGGEGFAYAVQSLGLGKVVGEVTGGGANPTGGYPLGYGLMASIPYGRAESPVTKTNWEGRGIQPDIPVVATDALKAALERLGQPGLADIAAASRERVFAPRSTPLPGTEAALRTLLAGLQSGEIDYSTMAPQFADMTRQQGPRLQSLIRSLGELRSITFFGPGVGPGGDSFRVVFADGALTMSVGLDPDGKLIGAAITPG
jgi:hypothetical protein